MPKLFLYVIQLLLLFQFSFSFSFFNFSNFLFWLLKILHCLVDDLINSLLRRCFRILSILHLCLIQWRFCMRWGSSKWWNWSFQVSRINHWVIIVWLFDIRRWSGMLNLWAFLEICIDCRTFCTLLSWSERGLWFLNPSLSWDRPFLTFLSWIALIYQFSHLIQIYIQMFFRDVDYTAFDLSSDLFTLDIFICVKRSFILFFFHCAFYIIHAETWFVLIKRHFLSFISFLLR